MRVERTTPALDAVDMFTAHRAAQATRPVATAQSNPAAEVVEVAVQQQAARPEAPASLLNLSNGDRAAIAGATGFYISATGEVSPEGMVPWTFVLQFLQERRAGSVERPIATTPTPPQVQRAAAVQAGPQVDVSV